MARLVSAGYARGRSKGTTVHPRKSYRILPDWPPRYRDYSRFQAPQRDCLHMAGFAVRIWSETLCGNSSGGFGPTTEPKVIGSNPIGCIALGKARANVQGEAIADSLGDDAGSLDREMMRRALALAREAMDLGEVPVGSLVARDGRVVAQACNLRETLNDPTAHAERLALTLAGQTLGSWRLERCTIYVTLEPCPMCAGAIVLSRIARVVYGAADPKAGACESLYHLVSDPRLNHRALVTAGVLADECGALLSEFFRGRRARRDP